MNKLKILGIESVLAVLGSLAIALSIAKFNNLKNLAKKAAPVAACGLIVAIPIAGIGGVDVASASPDSGSEIPEDYYDETAEAIWGNPAGIMDWGGGIKAIDKSLNEPVKIPDEITERIIKDNTNIHGKKDVKTIKISPTDFAVWLGATSETGWVKPYLVYLDTDGDNKPEELAALYNYPYAKWYAAEHLEPPLKGHFIDVTGYGTYLINPFEIPKEDMGSTHKLVYIKNPDKISVMMHEEEVIDQWGKKKGNITLPDKILWHEAIGKTPAELGLDKYDRFVSKIPEAPDEVPTGEEVTPTPGFEVGFAIAGLLAVAYVLRRRK